MVRVTIISLVLGVLLFIAGLFAGPQLLYHSVKGRLLSQCKSCQFRCGGSSLNWTNATLGLKDCVLRLDEPQRSIVVELNSIKGDLELAKLWTEDLLHFERFSVFGFLVDYHDKMGDQRVALQKKPQESQERRSPEKAVSQAETGKDMSFELLGGRQGVFVYRNDTVDGTGILTLSDVNFSIDGLEEGVAHGPAIDAEASAVLEASGTVHLSVAVKEWSPLSLVVELLVQNQDLAPTNAFFSKEAGIELEGILEQADAQVFVEQDVASADVAVRYRNFDVTFLNDKSRNAFETVLMNIGERFIFRTRSGDEGKRADASIRQQGGEKVVPLILRSLQEAALQTVQ